MIDCVSAEMRDVLPDFVHGQLDAGREAEVRAHIAGCTDCAAEVELLQAVMAAAPVAPAMNVDRIARALPTPTRHGFLLHRGGGTGSPLTPDVSPQMPHRSRIWSRPVVKVAAAVAIVAAGGLSLLVGRDVLRPDVQVGQVSPPAPSVPSAPDTPVAAIAIVPAPSAPEPRPRQVAVATTAGISLAGELQELSDEHLETLLAELDKMEGLPAAEPDQLEPAVGNDSGGAQQ
jgi:hypothetical protein